MRNAAGIAENKARIRAGEAIANRLYPVRTRKEVAKMLGISAEAVRITEGLALFKLQKRMKELEIEVRRQANL
jgi:DNA-directed RNA polymerase specialized sigma24 family protein